jgi:hypothetical protein
VEVAAEGRQQLQRPSPEQWRRAGTSGAGRTLNTLLNSVSSSDAGNYSESDTLQAVVGSYGMHCVLHMRHCQSRHRSSVIDGRVRGAK